MAAYTDNHHSFCNHLSLSSGLTSGTQHHNQEVSISELVDHGSISFGKFAPESLAWEKWSVFSHNRCQEELEKFKAPGLVAQKKAFFEEYYKKIRAMKKLQAEQQETEKSKLSHDSSNITHVETNDETTDPEEEKNCSDSIQTFHSSDDDDETIPIPNDNVIINSVETETSLATVVNEEQGRYPNGDIINRDESKTSSATVLDEEQGQNSNGDIINRDESKTSSATVLDEEQGQNTNGDIFSRDDFKTSSAAAVDKAEQVPVLPIEMRVKSSLQNGFDSSTVKLNADLPRDRAAHLKAKDIIISARDRKKDYRTKKDDIIKPSEKQKRSVDMDTSGKSTSQNLSERANPKLTKSDNVSPHKPSTKARSSATLSQTSVTKDIPTSSHSVRSGVPKATLNLTSVIKDRPTSSHSVRSGVPKAILNSTSVIKDRPTSSHSVRSGVPKATLNSASVVKDRPTSSHGVRHGVPKANLYSPSATKDRPTSSCGVRSVPKANLNPPSVIKDRPTSSYGVKSGAPKANLHPSSSVKDRPASPYSVRSVLKANLNSTSFLKDWPTSSSSVRTSVPKISSTNKIQATSKPKSVTNCVDNVGSGKRSHAGVLGKSLETMPKRGLPENQKPKVGLTSSPARIKSKQNLANESGFKNSNGGSKTKNLVWQSADMTQARKELRPKTPGWR